MELGLQLRDAPQDRRVIDFKLGRSRADGTMSGHGEKISNIIPVDRHCVPGQIAMLMS
jgi:hypothetical protein